MTVTTGRVPVRITIWKDGMQLDMRAWLDKLDIEHDAPEASEGPPWPFSAFRGSRTEYTVTAHNDANDPPWKFNRGKPA